MSKPKAIVIEDDPKLSTIFSQALRMAEFETEVIKDGQEAMERLGDIAPSLVVLDLHLPHVSGREILEHIRNDPRLEDTMVVLATADSAMADTLQTEADLVLLKPISFSQLRDMAARLRP